MAKKVIIMVRVNEYMPRHPNPHVPFTPAEIAETSAECEAAGAAIIHFHARKPDGAPSHDAEDYLEIVERIRARSNLLIDSTLGQNTIHGDEKRAAHIVRMGESKVRADLAAVDVGSTNLDVYDAQAKRFRTTNKTYVNTTETCIYLAERMREAGVKPHLTCWTIPFLRAADALMDSGVFQQPAYVQFAFCEGGILGGHPCTIDGAQAFLRCLPKDKRIEWTVTCKEGNLLPAAAVALENGGHLSPGIGDYPYPELGYPTNAKLVEFFANLARAWGRDVASPDEAREMLGLPQRATQAA
ncbi:BKACE family enzyme [Falsiroseomonas oryziterrae]|uniref:3-keto-5-aminohexanoate cleavage protein n=1 Tax=Falsiroseomonas oryziterrae TaxID=2911368 RepID=UPI001F3DEA93|nr:3-keto-5-aminohexanoate cleavage protein [Roseomonas sp. NPKOSM-4]